MGILLLLLLVVLLIHWIVIRRRLADLHRRVDRLSLGTGDLLAGGGLAALETRVRRLERLLDRGERAETLVAAPSAPSDATARRLPEFPLEAGEPQRCSRCGLWNPGSAERCDCGFPLRLTPEPAAAESPAPALVPDEPAPAAEPAVRTPFLQTAGQWVQEQMAGAEWEAVIGGSWLNKLGVLVLVIGLALFLGYSLTQLGPAGKIAVGFAVSAALLVGGVVLERRARYVVFARGLIGGGWAALYFTTYATHGLDATRVIHDPLPATILLGVVAAGIILHSLRYRSQTVTGVAYVVGFVTVTISPVSTFSLIASVPLAASLLVVAQRFSWTRMAVGGVIATYGTYAFRHAVDSSSSVPDLVSGQSVLATYWLLFEALDLVRLVREREASSLSRTIFPLNACGFIGVSLLQWAAVAPDSVYRFLGMAGAAYLASAVLRARLRPLPAPSEDAEDTAVLARALSGGYEGAVTVAVALVTPAIFLRFSGFGTTIALLLEAEFLFLAGLRLRQPYLRALAAAVLILPVMRLALVDVPRDDRWPLGTVHLRAWTPLALLMMAVFYVNRALIRSGVPSSLLLPERAYSYVASALVALVLGFEVAHPYLGLAWLVAALPLYEVGLRGRIEELRFQSYGLAALGLVALLATKVFGVGIDAAHSPWLTLGPAVLLTYASAARLLRVSPLHIYPWERDGVRDVGSSAGTALLVTLLWHVLPTPLVAVGWGVLSALLIEIGLSLRLQAVRAQGHLVAALTFGRLFLANFTGFGETGGVSHRILTVLPLIVLFYYLRIRLRREEVNGGLRSWEESVSRAYLSAPAILGVVLIRFEVGRVLAVVGWALLMLVLLVVGIRWNNSDLRWQSYAVALLTFARAWATNFYIPESLAGIAGRVTTGGIVIACLYLAQCLSPRRLDAPAPRAGNWVSRALTYFDRHARPFFSALATVLLTVLLLYEVAGRLLTVAWGLEGVALAMAGFAMHERSLRLSGLVLLGVCILKVFLYDLRELDTIFRILSFVVLGLVLLGVSLAYTRFRGQLQRYL